ncbi:Hexapeptide repeat of succinyl-transferase [Butyrivibrio sp. ob235]|uniref:acyltransferase n=1 Tax=Butyrivibrio sp. ob235 TaxID=1761780 RepID=UPI0008BF2294|nr:acyltransferase [Butyrivibrio sp. ob235]SEL73775.1 Hexapeptide repeat of succinyl-transferase [Butyrivibrio sp. ob235]
MKEAHIDGTDFMGENLRDKLAFCGENARLYPLCKMIHPGNAVLEDNCQLFDFVFIDAGEKLRIGKYSTLTWNVLIEGGAKTDIGHRVFLGPGTKVLTSTYEFDGYYSIEHLPGDAGKIRYGDVIIEDDAYIGANCTILPGTIIREGAFVGANSLVKGELEPWTVYVGSPCKKIRLREKPTSERTKIVNAMNWESHVHEE